MHGKRKYLLKSEIDLLRDRRSLRKDMVLRVLGNPGERDYMREELEYGDPVQWYSKPEHAETAVKSNPRMFLNLLAKILGGDINVTVRTGEHL
jgi:hypothetical protein